MTDKKVPMQPRNDYVLIRRIMLGETPSGIAMPDGSLEGVKHRVSAIGPKVTDLKVGDEVLMVGKIGEDYAFLPNSKDLILTRECNVVLVYNYH